MTRVHQLTLGAPGQQLAPESKRKRPDKWALLPEQLDPARFYVLGAPRTKNTGQIVRIAGFPRVIPSKPYRAWLKAALAQVPALRAAHGLPGRFLARVNVTAVFYRDRDVGDEDRYTVGFGDFLQEAGLIKNDKQIHWTGETRLELAKKSPPRVEVEIRLAPIGGKC